MTREMLQSVRVEEVPSSLGSKHISGMGCPAKSCSIMSSSQPSTSVLIHVLVLVVLRLIHSIKIKISLSSNIVQMDGCARRMYCIAMRESVLWISDVINLVLVLAV